MATRLLNVRLDEDHARKARALKENGVSLSDLVREAIDRRFEELKGAEAPRDIEAVLRAAFEKYPDEPDQPVRTYDVHDRRAAAEAIRAHLRRRHGNSV